MKQILDQIWNASPSAVLNVANQAMSEVLIGMSIVIIFMIVALIMVIKLLNRN